MRCIFYFKAILIYVFKLIFSFLSYRLINNEVSPTLGIHLGVRQLGAIKANDVIYVEDKCPK